MNLDIHIHIHIDLHMLHRCAAKRIILDVPREKRIKSKRRRMKDKGKGGKGERGRVSIESGASRCTVCREKNEGRW